MAVACSIVVPCYNEARNLPTLISRFAALRAQESDWELVLVNNGSTDDSEDVLTRELSFDGREFVRVAIVPQPNIGYGHGIMTGLREATGEYLAWTHADLQTPPADVIRGLDVLRNASDPHRTFVKGRRRHRPLRDVAFTFGMTLAAFLSLRRWLPDINGQPKCFHRELLNKAVAPPVDLSIDLYFFWLARQNGFLLREIDVLFRERLHGESRWAFNWRSKLRNVLRTLRFMLDLAAGRP